MNRLEGEHSADVGNISDAPGRATRLGRPRNSPRKAEQLAWEAKVLSNSSVAAPLVRERVQRHPLHPDIGSRGGEARFPRLQCPSSGA